MPAVTVNNYGKGKVYYIASDLMSDGYKKMYKEWLKDVISSDKMPETPENVSVTMRYSSNAEYAFVMNFNNSEQKVSLPEGYEVISGSFEGGMLKPYGVVVLKKNI